MEPTDDTFTPRGDSQRTVSEQSGSDESQTGEVSSGAISAEIAVETQVPARDVGSLAIGGTIGGILAARALKGAVGTGAKALAAGYIAKRFGQASAQARNSEVAPTPVEAPAVNEQVPPAAPEIAPEPEAEPTREAVPEPEPATTPLQGATLEMADPAPAAVSEELAAPAEPERPPVVASAPEPPVADIDDRQGEPQSEAEEVLPESKTDAEKHFADEVREAESELEEALYLIAEDGLGPAEDPGSVDGPTGGGLDEESEVQASPKDVIDPPGLAVNSAGRLPLTEAEVEPEVEKIVAPPRSPFLRDHGGPPADPDEPGEPGEPSAAPQVSVEETEIDSTGAKSFSATVEIPVPAAPIPSGGAGSDAPESGAMPVPEPGAMPPMPTALPAAELPKQPTAPATDLAGPPPDWQPGQAEGDSALPPATPALGEASLGAPPSPFTIPPAEPSLPTAPPAPSSASPLPTAPAPAPAPAAHLPGMAATELPKATEPLPAPEPPGGTKPPVELPPRRKEASPPPSKFVPSPQVYEPGFVDDTSVPPSLAAGGTVLPPAAPPAESPLTLASDAHAPLTEVPLQARPPAAPLTDMPAAPRPQLTAAEFAAKKRAEKLANKKAGKGEPTEPSGESPASKSQSKPKGKSKPKRVKAPKSKAKPKRKKSKNPGGLRRLMLVGPTLVIVLGGATTFGYLNREKIGFGAAAAIAGGGDELPGIPVAAPLSGTKKPDTIIPQDIFADPHVIPGGGGQTSKQPDGDPIEEPPPALQVTDEERQQIIRDPKRTLEAFLLAGTIDELLHYVADREIVGPEMRAYYKDGKRTPIATEDIQFEDTRLIPDTTLSACMYWVTSRRRRIPVSVEETEAGYRVDWAAFTQFHDARLEKFMREPGSEGGGFYVQLRRSHYFGNDLPDGGELQAFRVQSPIAPFTEAFVFLRKTNPEAGAILERYRWSTGYRPFVELKWVTPKSGNPRIELERVVRHTWRR